MDRTRGKESYGKKKKVLQGQNYNHSLLLLNIQQKHQFIYLCVLLRTFLFIERVNGCILS